MIAEILTKYFRDSTEYRKNISIKCLRLEYVQREREAILALMGGVLKDNPFLEEFELVALDGYTFLNINNFIENFEEWFIGKSLKKLTLREAFKFTEKTKFLEEGTKNV